MATNYVRLALEQAPNYEGASNSVSTATFCVPGTEFGQTPNAEIFERKDEIRGSVGPPTHMGAAQYMPEASLPVACYPGSIGVLLALAWGAPVTTQGDGADVVDPDDAAIPTTVYRHVFTRKAANPPQTCEIKHGNLADGLFYHATGVGCDSLQFAIDGAAWKATAGLKGLTWQTISDPSITPSYETYKPFYAGMMTVDWLGDGATIDEFSFGITSAIEQKHGMIVASLFPDVLQFTEAFQMLAGEVNKELFDADDWAAFVDGDNFAAVIKLLSTETVLRAAATIATSSEASPTVITTSEAHGITSGETVTIAGHSGSTPDINGSYEATVTAPTTFTIPVEVTGAGTGGTAVADTAYSPALWVEMDSCQYTSPDIQASTNGVRHPAKYNWEARTADGDSSYATVTLVNAVSSYATYA